MQFHAFSLIVQKFRQRDYTTGIFGDILIKEGFTFDPDRRIQE
jgi:hypothetical protein